MMRKSLLKTVFVLISVTSLIAQNPSNAQFIASNGSNPLLASTESANGNGDTPNINYLSAAQARQYVRSAFNLLREYTISVDTALITKSFTAEDKAAAKVATTTTAKVTTTTTPTTKVAATAAPTSTTATSSSSFESLSSLPDEKFEQYLQGMEKILQSKLKKAETDTYTDIAAKNERQALLRRLQTIMKSATCLVNKNEGIFIKTIDLDGNDIIAFRLDSLRSNSRYSLVENYREGLSRIRKDQVYGYLNYCGEEVIPAQYEFADAFNSGRALVKKVNWYFIDSNGEESDALENIADAKAVKSGVSLGKLTNGKYAFFNNEYDKTKQLTSSQYDIIEPFYKKQLFKVKTFKKMGLITLDGTVKLPVLYDAIEATKSGLFRIRLEERWGLIDSLGNVKFEAEFISISDFDNAGTAYANDEKGIHLINAKEFTITRGYASVSEVNQYGVATVRDGENKLYGLINAKLETVVKPTYFSLGTFNQYGLAEACLAANLCGFIDPTGKDIIPLTYDNAGDFSKQGFVVMKGTEKNCSERCNYEVILDKTGKTIMPKALKNAHKIRYEIQDSVFSEKYISVKVTEGSDAGFQLINKINLSIVNSTAYKNITPYDIYGIMRVANFDNAWGLIDSTGKVVAKCTYQEIKRPQENYYPTRDDKGKWGFIDKKGKPQIPFEYDEVRNFRKGYTIVQKGKDKFGIINRFNAKIVPAVFKTAVFNDDTHKYILTEENGTEIILNENLDCEKNATRLDEIRRTVNQ
jgi:WG containing repeat